MRFEPKSDGSLVACRSVLSWRDFYKARRRGNFPAMLDAEIRAVAAGEKLRSILRRDGHSDDDIAALLQEHRAETPPSFYEELSDDLDRELSALGAGDGH